MREVIALLCTATMFAFAASAHASTAHPDHDMKVAIVESTTVSAISGAPWQCHWTESAEAKGAGANFVLNFEADGHFYMTRGSVQDPFPGEWNVSGNDVQWNDGAGRLYTLALDGDMLSGRTSTFDLRQSRGRIYAGTIGCTRKVGVRLASLSGL